MKIGLTEPTTKSIQKVLANKEERTVWHRDNESLVGPFDDPVLRGQGLKLFEGENGKEQAAREIRAIAGIMKATRKDLFPAIIRMWCQLPYDTGSQGLILLSLPNGKPLSAILDNPEDYANRTAWQAKYDEEIKKDIYTDQISPADFWTDEKKQRLVLVSLKHIKDEFLTP